MQNNSTESEKKSKKCPMCQQLKLAEAFYKSAANGLSPYCRPCSAERKRKGTKTKEELRKEAYPTDTTKVCSKCKIEKDRGLFNIRVRGGKEELRVYCKDCQSASFKNWASSSGKQKYESREAKAAASVAITYPEPGKKICSSCSRCLPADAFGARFDRGGNCKECRSIDSAKHYAENRDSYIRYAKEYRANNLQAVRAMALRGQKKRHLLMKKARANSRVTPEEKFRLVAKYGYTCMCCGSIEKITFDHVIPITKGGKDEVSNIQLLCGSCNSSKGQKSTDYRPNGALTV